jgi:hypothetical protein
MLANNALHCRCDQVQDKVRDAAVDLQDAEPRGQDLGMVLASGQATTNESIDMFFFSFLRGLWKQEGYIAIVGNCKS